MHNVIVLVERGGINFVPLRSQLVCQDLIFEFLNERLVIQARNYKMHVRITGKTLIRLLLQKQSDLGLPCLSRLFWQATTCTVQHLTALKYMNVVSSFLKVFC